MKGSGKQKGRNFNAVKQKISEFNLYIKRKFWAKIQSNFERNEHQVLDSSSVLTFLGISSIIVSFIYRTHTKACR